MWLWMARNDEKTSEKDRASDMQMAVSCEISRQETSSRLHFSVLLLLWLLGELEESEKMKEEKKKKK